MIHSLPQKARPRILIAAFTGFCFVACGIDEGGTNPNTTASSSSSVSSSSSGMGGELVTSSSSSGSANGGAGVGGAGGGSGSSSSGSTGKLGAPCMLASECTSNVCEDGVCCEKTCNPCESCNLADSMGTCKALAAGTDDCPMDGQLCSMLGQCECGVSLPLKGDGACPADMKWSQPQPGVCTYTCDQMDECKNKADVTCAPGSDCIIDCSGKGSCEGTTFNCPAGYKCTMKCPNMDSCKNSVLNCSDDGPCNVECTSGGMSCNMTVNCGFNSCRATCTDSTPTLIPKKNGVCAPMPCIP